MTPSVTSSPYRHILQTTSGVTQHLLNPLAPRALAHTPTSQLLYTRVHVNTRPPGWGYVTRLKGATSHHDAQARSTPRYDPWHPHLLSFPNAVRVGGGRCCWTCVAPGGGERAHPEKVMTFGGWRRGRPPHFGVGPRPTRKAANAVGEGRRRFSGIQNRNCLHTHHPGTAPRSSGAVLPISVPPLPAEP